MYENFNQSSGSIATNSSNCKGEIASRIQERNRRRILDALADGCDYLKMKKLMRGKDTFKIWLESIGKTAAEAKKYVKLYQVFVDFSIEAIAGLSLPTLFALCQKRYQQLVGSSAIATASKRSAGAAADGSGAGTAESRKTKARTHWVDKSSLWRPRFSVSAAARG